MGTQHPLLKRYFKVDGELHDLERSPPYSCSLYETACYEGTIRSLEREKEKLETALLAEGINPRRSSTWPSNQRSAREE
jgi:hypothetical protein